MRELKIFFTALMFYTRIPCPSFVGYTDENLKKASRYFPLVGCIVGGLAGLVFYLAHAIFPLSISIILSMITTILLTGAFHEDGFADTCDGFGGGWTREQILEIMKDSRIGAYGTIGLIFILFMKFLLLSEIGVDQIPFVLITAHALSRFAVTTLKFTHHYILDRKDSKFNPIAEKISLGDLFWAAVFGITPLFLFPHRLIFVLIIPVLWAGRLLARYFKTRIGGYTGDCLGATQQVCEIVFYLSFLLLWKFI